MAESSDITLDPGVLEGNQGEAVPITDLYGMPVFNAEVEKQIQEAGQKKEQELKDIRSQVFSTHTDKTAQTVSEIRSQIFQTEPVLTKTESSRGTTAGGGSSFLVLQFMAVTFLIIMLFYQRHRQKRRREVPDDINDNGK